MQQGSGTRAVVAGGVVWLAAALAAGATGAFTALRPPAPQLVILALTIATVVATGRVPAVRALAEEVSLRALAGVHVVRLVGVVFVLMGAGGQLAPDFAMRAGWGDIAAAVGAIALVTLVSPASRAGRRTWLAWNVFGVLDLVVAVGTATAVVLRGETPGMDPLFRFPLVVVPMFVVPLLFASHYLLFRRLLAPARA